MEDTVKKISHFLSFAVVFVCSAYLYFGFKGFVFENGTLVLQKQEAMAEEHNGIATILPDDLTINASEKYAIGDIDAPLTLFEYSSLTCPHCADFHLGIEPKLMTDYVDKGLLRIVFVNFPLDKNSMSAAMLAECMSYENYFGFLDKLFDTQRSWWLDRKPDTLFKYAAEYGISYDEAVACTKNNAVASDIVANRQEAISKLHMQGTPAFLFVGEDGNEIIYGVPGYSELKQYLDNRLQNLK